MRPLVLLVTALSLTACSTLTVRVDVADRRAIEQWDADRLMDVSLFRALSETEDSIRHQVDSLREARLNQYLQDHEKELSGLSGKERDEARSRLRDTYLATTGAFYDSRRTVLVNLRSGLAFVYGQTKDCQDQIRRWSAKGAKRDAKPDCLSRHPEVVGFLRERETTLRELERGPDFVLKESSGVLNSLIGQDGLFREREAFNVTSAPETYWKRKFDQSFAWALFGDTNVAIKMESRGNFSIKGVSFDPSEVTRVASKVVTQSLLAWTQIAGVPAGAAAQKPGSTPVVLAQDDEARARYDAQDADQWRALLTVADSVAAADERMSGTDEQRNAAIASLVAIWNANKPRLFRTEEPSTISQFTLSPGEASIRPNDSVTLYPAVARSREGDEKIALVCTAHDECPFANLPAFVTLPKGKSSAQFDVKANAEPAWGDYTVAATLNGDSKNTTIHVAPRADFKGVPQTILAGVATQTSVQVGVKPAGSKVDVVIGGEGKIRAAGKPATPDGKIEIELNGDEGSGALTVTAGSAQPQRYPIQAVKGAISVQPQSLTVAVGQDGTFKITTTLPADVRDKMNIAVDVPANIAPLASTNIHLTNGEGVLTIRGAAAGRGEVKLTPAGGDAVPVTVNVVSVSAKANGSDIANPLVAPVGDTVIDVSATGFTADTEIQVGVDDSTTLQVPATIKLTGNGSAAPLTIHALKAGNATISLTLPGAAVPLKTIAVSVQ